MKRKYIVPIVLVAILVILIVGIVYFFNTKKAKESSELFYKNALERYLSDKELTEITILKESLVNLKTNKVLEEETLSNIVSYFNEKNILVTVAETSNIEENASYITFNLASSDLKLVKYTILSYSDGNSREGRGYEANYEENIWDVKATNIINMNY